MEMVIMMKMPAECVRFVWNESAHKNRTVQRINHKCDRLLLTHFDLCWRIYVFVFCGKSAKFGVCVCVCVERRKKWTQIIHKLYCYCYLCYMSVCVKLFSSCCCCCRSWFYGWQIGKVEWPINLFQNNKYSHNISINFFFEVFVSICYLLMSIFIVSWCHMIIEICLLLFLLPTLEFQCDERILWDSFTLIFDGHSNVKRMRTEFLCKHQIRIDIQCTKVEQ